jgi:hypothetical protein
VDRAATTRSLGLNERQADASPALKGLADHEPAAGDVDVDPAEAQGLTDPEACRAEDDQQWRQLMSASLVEKAYQLLGTERRHLAAPRPRREDEGSRVTDDHAPLESMPQRPVEDGMDLVQAVLGQAAIA